MQYKMIMPCEALRKYIHYFWESDHQDSGTKAFTYYSTADSFSKMVFIFQNFSGPGFGSITSSIQGQTEKNGQIKCADVDKIFGISFYPYAIPALFDFSPGDFNENVVDLTDSMGSEGALLTERIAFARTTDERVQLINDFFYQKLMRRQIKDQLMIDAIQHIRKMQGTINIATFAGDFFLSEKQFKRRFNNLTGFTPKLYSQIVRFEVAIDNYQKFSSLTELAHALGYFDQSHFVKDFKRFSGFSPSQYFSITSH